MVHCDSLVNPNNKQVAKYRQNKIYIARWIRLANAIRLG